MYKDDVALPNKIYMNKLLVSPFTSAIKDLIDDELTKNGLTLQEVFDFFDAYLDIKNNPFDDINKKIISLL